MTEQSRSRRSNGDASSKRTRSSSNGRRPPAEIVREAARLLNELTGRRPEAVLGIQREEDDHWRVTVEVVEMQRVPSSTDLMGCYIVSVDDRGELLGYERTRRYARGQVGGDGG